MSWSETIDGGPDPDPARALLAAYRRRVEAPAPVELPMFTAGVAAWLNWTATRVMIVLDHDEDEPQRPPAERNVPGLLAAPLSLDRLERFVAALE